MARKRGTIARRAATRRRIAILSVALVGIASILAIEVHGLIVDAREGPAQIAPPRATRSPDPLSAARPNHWVYSEWTDLVDDSPHGRLAIAAIGEGDLGDSIVLECHADSGRFLLKGLMLFDASAFRFRWNRGEAVSVPMRRTRYRGEFESSDPKWHVRQLTATQRLVIEARGIFGEEPRVVVFSTDGVQGRLSQFAHHCGWKPEDWLFNGDEFEQFIKKNGRLSADSAAP